MNIDNNKPLAILGNPNSGKTNLMFFFASLCSAQRKRYTLGYPKYVEGFKNLSTLEDLAKIEDAVVLIDEFDKYISLTDKRANHALMQVLKFCEHKRIKLVFNTQLSQFITKQVSALVPQWAILNIDYFGLKNGSKPKRILQYIKHPLIETSFIGMNLPMGKFVFWDDYGEVGDNGVHDYPNMDIKKDWNLTKRQAKKKLREAEEVLEGNFC